MMYKRPYVTALWLSMAAIVGTIGQMLTTGLANVAFLCLSAVPLVLAAACLRRTR